MCLPVFRLANRRGGGRTVVQSAQVPLLCVQLDAKTFDVPGTVAQDAAASSSFMYSGTPEVSAAVALFVPIMTE